MDFICNVYFSIGLKNKEWFVPIRELNKIERNNHVKTFVGVEAVS